MSFGMIVTHFAWMAQMFAYSRSPTKNASPASCKASTAELCNFNPSLHFCMISLTSLWKVTLLMRRSAPFWYFWISIRACMPHCIFLCSSTFSSLMIFNCLSFLFLSVLPSLYFLPLTFSCLLTSYPQLLWPSLSLPSPLTPLLFLPSLITEDGPNSVCIYWASPIITFFKANLNWNTWTEIQQLLFNLSTKLIVWNTYNAGFSWLFFQPMVGQIPNVQLFLLLISP